MIRLALAFLLSLAAPVLAKPWFCTAPLDATISELRSPLSLELSLDPDGTFKGRMERRAHEATSMFDWMGNWIRLDGRLAMIGMVANARDDTRVELRAFSTRQGAQSLFLAIRHPDEPQQTLRCLRTRLE